MESSPEAGLDVGLAIDALLAATPEPPAAESDPAEVLQLAERMLAERAVYCSRIDALTGAARAIPATHASQHALLTDRDARWTARLAGARRALADQLSAAHRHRGASR